MSFIQFDITEYYSTGELKTVQEIQLNSTHRHSLCRDLTYVRIKNQLPQAEGFLLFCKGFREKPIINEGDAPTIEPYYTVIFISLKYSGKLEAREYVFTEEMMYAVPDFRKGGNGLRYLKLLAQFNPRGDNRLHFSTLATHIKTGKIIQSIFELSMTELSNQPAYTSIEGPPILRLVQEFFLTERVEVNRVLDMLIVKYDRVLRQYFIAFSILNEGIRICAFPFKDIVDPKMPVLVCDRNKAQVITGIASPVLFKPEPPSHYQKDRNQEQLDDDDDDEQFFYGIRFKPPEVVEYDVEDIRNIKLFKKYALVDLKSDEYLGSRDIAVNRNYVLHLLENPETSEQIIRVYSRPETNMNSAKFEIHLCVDAKTNFLAFPNYYLNHFILRDERMLNLTVIKESALIINATNSTLVQKYARKMFKIRLVVQDTFIGIPTNFSITFLLKDDLDIFPLSANPQKTEEVQIFYNCGEANFKYLVSKHYDGPNYMLVVESAKQQYFNFENQDMWITFEHDFHFERCKMNFIFPILGEDLEKNEEGVIDDTPHQNTMTPTILLCVDFERQRIRNYRLSTKWDIKNQTRISIVNRTSRITLPFTKFIDFTYDRESRIIIGLIENQNQIDPTSFNDTAINKYEFHLFNVQNEVVWIQSLSFPELQNITYLSYNHILNSGLIIEFFEIYVKDTNELKQKEFFYIYKWDDMARTISYTRLNNHYGICYENRTIRAVLVSEEVMITSTADRRIRVYQLGMVIQLLMEFQVPDLVNFDVFDCIFLLIYRGNNVIELYDIKDLVFINYRMILPLYQEFKDFQFVITSQSDFKLQVPQVVRTYMKGTISFLMQKQKPNRQNDTILLIYGLNFTQHNTFIMVKNLSEFYETEKAYGYSNIIFTGHLDADVHTIGVMNAVSLRIYNTQFYNQLVLDPKAEAQSMLIERCKSIQQMSFNASTKTGIYDYLELIDTVAVHPKTQFLEGKPLPHNYQKLNLQIFSQNQGLAVSSKSNADSHVQISYASDSRENDLSQLKILHETYMQGQALHFRTSCSYRDEQGQLANCTRDGVIEEVNDVPYNFSIEFATSERKIVQQFTIGKLFFMFDTTFKMNVLRLPRYEQNLGPVNGYPLIRINESDQNETFGCAIKGYANYFNYTDTMNPVNESYLFFYHCNESWEIEGTWVLRVAIITAFNDAYNEDDSDLNTGFSKKNLYSIQTFDGQIQIPYNIIDIDKINLGKVDITGNGTNFFFIAVSCEIPDSETNLLMFIELMIKHSEKRARFSLIKTFSAYNLQLDTFKVTKLIPVRQSKLLFAILQDNGALIFNMTEINIKQYRDEDPKYIRGEIDILKDTKFYQQQYDQTEMEFVVHSFSLNLPTSALFITNFGIYQYEFPVDLSQEELLCQNIRENLIPISMRQIRLHYDLYNGEIVQNPFGNAFLIKKKVLNGIDHVYRTQLVGMSYYSAPASQIFKIINVVNEGSEDSCIALNQNSYFELTPEDQLAVTFICNQYLYMYRICMRPHVIIELDHFINNATKLSHGVDKYLQGVMQFNQFQLNISATNDHSKIDKAINTDTIIVSVSFQEKPKGREGLYYGALVVIVIGLILFMLSYIDKNVCKRKEKRSQDNLNDSKALRSSVISGFQQFNDQSQSFLQPKGTIDDQCNYLYQEIQYRSLSRISHKDSYQFSPIENQPYIYSNHGTKDIHETVQLSQGQPFGERVSFTELQREESMVEEQMKLKTAIQDESFITLNTADEKQK